MQIATADTTNDTLLDSIIDRATEWIEGQTDRKLKARKYNAGGSTHATTGVTDEDYVFFSGTTKAEGGDTITDPETGHGIFDLPQWPVRPNSDTTFVLATLTGRTSGGETWNTTALTEWQDYVVERDKGVLRLLSGRFSPAFRNYRITMAAGYLQGGAQPYVPADLEQLCIAVSRKIFRNEHALTAESIGTWSRSYDAEKADADIQATVARYRRYSI